MGLRPLNNRVIVDPDPFEFTDKNPEIVRILKEGLIKLPDEYEFSLKKASPTGKLVSWGDQCKYKSNYRVGKKVWFAQFSTEKIKVEDKEYKILNEWDLHALEDD